MKQLLQFCFARQPRLYRQVLFLKGRGKYSLDKMVFLSLVKDKDIVFDVGANLGYYTVLFSHMVGSEGEVHAFEPVPSTFKLLGQSVVEQCRYRNIHLNNVAVGDSRSRAEIHVPGGDLGQASLRRHESGSWSGSTEIASYVTEVITIDDYVREHHLSKLDFIKLDVEGYELICLKGATETLSKFMPLLYAEICVDWSRGFGYTPVDIVEFLQNLGYTCFYLVRDQIKRLENATTQLKTEMSSGSANLICSAPAVHSHRLRSLPLFR